MSDTPKRGFVATIISCSKCLRILDPTSSDDCPDHPMPCCGGLGAMHEPGCESNPMFQAGQRWAAEREQAVLVAFLGANPDGTGPAGTTERAT